MPSKPSPAPLRQAMSPHAESRVPMAYGNIPSFLGARPVGLDDLGGLDAVVAGLPWEGANTWGGPSGCEQTPKLVRLAALRYGAGYLPEYEVEVMSALAVGDAGDLPSFPGNPERTFAGFSEAAARIFAAGALPLFLGGDHAVSYPVVAALAKDRPGRFGIIQLDAHLDNAEDYGGDPLARCCPLRRMAELPGLDPSRMVHLGIRGPRNTRGQMEYARSVGATVLTMPRVRSMGLAAALAEAARVAGDGLDGYYVTVCSDILDRSSNPGGPADFDGLTGGELCHALFGLGQGPLLGLDLVEVYPLADPSQASMHLLAWLAIYALAGVASRSAGA